MADFHEGRRSRKEEIKRLGNPFPSLPIIVRFIILFYLAFFMIAQINFQAFRMDEVL